MLEKRLIDAGGDAILRVDEALILRADHNGGNNWYRPHRLALDHVRHSRVGSGCGGNHRCYANAAVASEHHKRRVVVCFVQLVAVVLGLG